MTDKPKRTRRTAEEKEAERLANLCRCSANCQIPKADPESVKEHGSTETWCGCKDYEFRGGSYPDPDTGNKICRHIHHVRVESFQAPEGTPLHTFQNQNPTVHVEDLITKLWGPKPTKETNATRAQDAHHQAYIQRMKMGPQIDVDALLGRPKQPEQPTTPPRRTLRRIEE